MRQQISFAVSMAGGEGFALLTDSAQRFADAWHKVAGTAQATVPLILGLAMAGNGSILMLEFDGKACLVSFTTITLADFKAILATLPKLPGADAGGI